MGFKGQILDSLNTARDRNRRDVETRIGKLIQGENRIQY